MSLAKSGNVSFLNDIKTRYARRSLPQQVSLIADSEGTLGLGVHVCVIACVFCAVLPELMCAVFPLDLYYIYHIIVIYSILLGHAYVETNFSVVANLCSIEMIQLGPFSGDDTDPIVHMDIGCGKGLAEIWRLQILRNSGSHIGIGIDVTPRLVQAARDIRLHLQSKMSTEDPLFCDKVSFHLADATKIKRFDGVEVAFIFWGNKGPDYFDSPRDKEHTALMCKLFQCPSIRMIVCSKMNEHAFGLCPIDEATRALWKCYKIRHAKQQNTSISLTCFTRIDTVRLPQSDRNPIKQIEEMIQASKNAGEGEKAIPHGVKNTVEDTRSEYVRRSARGHKAS